MKKMTISRVISAVILLVAVIAAVYLLYREGVFDHEIVPSPTPQPSITPSPTPTPEVIPTPYPTPTPEVTPPISLKKEIHQDFDATPALAGLLKGAWIYSRISNLTKEDIGFEVTMSDDVVLPMYDIGKPIVPYISKEFKIPKDSVVESVTVNLSDPTTIHNIFIEPAPRPPRAEYVMDNETYTSSNPYPGKEYRYKEAIGRDLHTDTIVKFVIVHVFPIQYIPLKSRIIAYKNASISISYRVPAQEEE